MLAAPLIGFEPDFLVGCGSTTSVSVVTTGLVFGDSGVVKSALILSVDSLFVCSAGSGAGSFAAPGSMIVSGAGSADGVLFSSVTFGSAVVRF